ncbi:MAG: hypothetical protein VXW65_02015 [Pseudomonadota bacterium]|nr:hypothetical protein [Pseudomonadota bacterium]
MPTVTGGKLNSQNGASTTAELSYDAAPMMPSEMIHLLDAHGFIHHEISPNKLGNIVLTQGALSFVDYEVIKDIIDIALDQVINDMPNTTSAHKRKIEAEKKQHKQIAGFVKKTPFSLQARLFTNASEQIWMTLSRDEMVGSAHDVNFKHGELIAGKWYVLGVLDATPYDSKQAEGHELDSFGAAISQLASLLKTQFGRPNSAYGMTPIAIFRVLTPRQPS